MLLERLDFEGAMREMAKRADSAVQRAMTKYHLNHVTDEDDITARLIGNLDAELEGEIGGLQVSTTIVRHRKGSAAEEKRTGADLLIHVSLDTSERKYSKGVLVQAKRIRLDEKQNQRLHSDLIDQCRKMLKISPSAYVFNYCEEGMRWGEAVEITENSNLNFHQECNGTPYNFFYDLFRCSIGDHKIHSPLVRDLPFAVKNILTIDASE